MTAAARLEPLRRAVLPLALAAGIVALGERDGGYFPASWGPAASAALVGCIALVLLRPRRPTRLELAYVGGLAAVLTWTALSALWTVSFSQTMFDVERGIVYPAAVLVVVLAGTARSVAFCTYLAALALGLHGLFQRLLPDVDAGLVYGDGRLGGPITYSNGFGLVVAIGVLLAVGFATSGEGRMVTLVAGATVVPLVLALYFTFSRGSWAALAVGVAALVALSPRRAEAAATILCLVPVPALAIWLASRSVPLSLGFVTPEDVRDGHRLAAAVVGFAAAEAALLVPARRLAARIAVPRRVARAAAVVATAALLVALVAALVRADSLYRSFATGKRGPVATSGGFSTYDPRARLFTIQGNQREAYWAVALGELRAHPLAGSGAGTFDVYWARNRPNTSYVHDAHSLYLETLGELGVVGFLLLLGTLLVPLVAAVRVRRRPLVAAAAAAYAAFAFHAGVDWDWELPAVTLLGLLAGAAVLAAARGAAETPGPALGGAVPALRGAVAAALAVLLAFSVVSFVGNDAVHRAGVAAAAGRWEAVDAPARRATRWTPWDSEAWRLRGEAALSRGAVAAAQAALREGLARDETNWRLWSRLAQVTAGADRNRALARAHELNPLAFP
jgi:hypothetical protein